MGDGPEAMTKRDTPHASSCLVNFCPAVRIYMSRGAPWGHHDPCKSNSLNLSQWLLLDSRVVDVTRSCNPIFITISSLKPFLFNDLLNEWRFVDRMEA